MDKILLFVKLLSFNVIVLDILLCFIYDNRQQMLASCPVGTFRIGSMHSCHQMLDCSDYKDMTPVMFLSRGLVKNIHLVKWNDNYLVVSNVSDKQYLSDFHHNLQMLKQLSQNALIVQLIGWCNNDMLFTEYHPNGDANNLPHIIVKNSIHHNMTSITLNLCVNYVKILDYLHNSPIGTRVMCDSNTLQKTLSQYLLTDELTLVLNDLDALPQVISRHKGVKCGPRQLFGTFVAPEQLWNRSDQLFSNDKMREYDHRTDIWKIPDVCQWFLKTSTHLDYQSKLLWVLSHLKDIHSQCKSIDPNLRPTANDVLNHKNDSKMHQKLN
ncbi:protein O-mannose kinase-like [Oppia nitens]|uniref:protein O-mannose kinase-like n=1 Tax=Oppia nitens TaxID=1686743 RepID=UPI0023DC051D|nr:protein O-mannose kinase-like [Oppia nitens]